MAAVVDKSKVSKRSARQAPGIKPQHDDRIGLELNAELAELPCCTRCCLNTSCLNYLPARSYMYVRENSLETNFSVKPFCCGGPRDFTTVTHMDTSPFVACECCNSWCKLDPVIEAKHNGCMICFTKCDMPEMCWYQKTVVVKPFSNLCFPCCCIPNKVHWIQNCCGLCGPITGQPCYFVPLSGVIAPLDAEEYAAVSTNIIQRIQNNATTNRVNAGADQMGVDLDMV